MRQKAAVVVALSLALSSCGQGESGRRLVVHQFSTSAEGWQVAGDTGPATPRFQPVGGRSAATFQVDEASAKRDIPGTRDRAREATFRRSGAPGTTLSKTLPTRGSPMMIRATGPPRACDYRRRGNADGPGLVRDDRRTGSAQSVDRRHRQRALRRDRDAVHAHCTRRGSFPRLRSVAASPARASCATRRNSSLRAPSFWAARDQSWFKSRCCPRNFHWCFRRMTEWC